MRRFESRAMKKLKKSINRDNNANGFNLDLTRLFSRGFIDSQFGGIMSPAYDQQNGLMHPFCIFQRLSEA